jgi:hypothetical protein
MTTSTKIAQLLAGCVANAVPDLILQRDQRRWQCHRRRRLRDTIDHQRGDVDLAMAASWSIVVSSGTTHVP